MKEKAGVIIAGITRYFTKRNAVQSVYWRVNPTSSPNQPVKLVKTSKTLKFPKDSDSKVPEAMREERKLDV